MPINLNRQTNNTPWLEPLQSYTPLTGREQTIPHGWNPHPQTSQTNLEHMREKRQYPMVATPPEKRRDNGLVAKGSIRLNGKGRGSLQRLNCYHGQTRQIVKDRKISRYVGAKLMSCSAKFVSLPHIAEKNLKRIFAFPYFYNYWQCQVDTHFKSTDVGYQTKTQIQIKVTIQHLKYHKGAIIPWGS